MSFTRLIYDKKAYETDLHQNMSPLHYTLNPSRNNHDKKEVVYKPSFQVSHPPILSNRNNIDIESELQRLYYKATKYPGYKFSPDCDSDKNCDTGYPCGCDTTDCSYLKQYKENKELKTEFSRLELDIDNYKDACVYERNFQPLQLDHQKLNRTIYQEDMRGGLDTRSQLKDNFKPCLKNVKTQDNSILHYGEAKHTHTGEWEHNHYKHGA